MDELEKVIDSHTLKMSHLGYTKTLAQTIRDAGYHKDLEYCNCIGNYVSYEKGSKVYCDLCCKIMLDQKVATPKRKQIEPIKTPFADHKDVTINTLIYRINALIDRVNELGGE